MTFRDGTGNGVTNFLLGHDYNTDLIGGGQVGVDIFYILLTLLDNSNYSKFCFLWLTAKNVKITVHIK